MSEKTQNEKTERNEKNLAGLFGTKTAAGVYFACQFLSLLTLALALISYFRGDTKIYYFKEARRSKLAEHIMLCVTALILTNIPLILRKKLKLYIPTFLQIVVTLFIVAHFVFGEIFRFYDYSTVFDKILHTMSGVVIAICGFSLINLTDESPNTHLKLSPFFVALFSFCFALAVGCLWEILEYSMDGMFDMNMQRWKDDPSGRGSGLNDTMMDLIVGAVGALIISLTGGIMLKLGSPKIQALLMSRVLSPASDTQEEGLEETQEPQENQEIQEVAAAQEIQEPQEN